MEETGHDEVVHSLIDLQARLRAEAVVAEPTFGTGAEARIASVTPLPIRAPARDRVAELATRLDQVEWELTGLSERIRRVERAGRLGGRVEGIDPDLVLDLQRLVAERLQIHLDEPR